jgi:hypothetical protein
MIELIILRPPRPSMNLSTAASGPQRFSTSDFKFKVEVASVTDSVYHEVFDKSAENRPLINQPVAVGPAYTGCSRINRLGAG